MFKTKHWVKNISDESLFSKCPLREKKLLTKTDQLMPKQ
jgi:hypothetical protein